MILIVLSIVLASFSIIFSAFSIELFILLFKSLALVSDNDVAFIFVVTNPSAFLSFIFYLLFVTMFLKLEVHYRAR